MSLLDEYWDYEKFHIVDKTTAPDGLGGVITVWVEGAEVKVALSQDAAPETKIANAITNLQSYTVVTPINVIFRQGDIIKRDRDEKYFRITSDADDLATPPSSSLDIRQCTAVEYEMEKKD